MSLVTMDIAKDEIVLDSSTPIENVAEMVAGRTGATIDCGVLTMSGIYLNEMMKAAWKAGVTDFKLLNVCGQNLIGTGITGPGVKIDVYGLMGNHSAAFIDQVELNTHPTRFPNGVWCPGDAQVAIGNTANPSELNIGGSVDDLFVSYCPSGLSRVAGQGGNRCGLRAGAGVPHVWREIDYSRFEGMTDEQVKEDLLYNYQLRKAKLNKLGFQKFLLEYKKKVADREPPIIVFGRKVRDYFMEYAQGTIGVILNVYDVPAPAGYYICSGMTAGRAFIRGNVGDDRLGVNMRKARVTEENREFLGEQIEGFYATFNRRLVNEYQERLDAYMERYTKDPDGLLDEFVKIVSMSSEE